MEWLKGLNDFSYYLELFAAVFIYMLVLARREKFWLRIACSIGLLWGGTFAVSFLNGILHGGYVELIFVLNVLLCLFCCKISKWDAIYCVSCGFLTQHFASSLYLFLQLNKALDKLSSRGYACVYIGIYILTYLAFYFIFARSLAWNGKFDTTTEASITMAVLVWGVCVILSVITKKAIDAINLNADSQVYDILFRTCQIYALFVCFLLLWVQRVQRKEIYAVRKMEQKEALWKQRQIQYEISRDNINLINQKCHDMRYQIAALSKTPDSYQKERFVKDIQKMVEIYDSSTDTGNKTLDTILMEKGLYCKLHHIQWTCVADGKLMDFMEDVDLYTLMGNALDNAIEGVEKIEKADDRVICVRLWKKNNFAVLQVENSYIGERKIKDGEIETSKPDKENHGFGLKAIKSISEKYSGIFTVKVEENIFVVNILFPINTAFSEEEHMENVNLESKTTE